MELLAVAANAMEIAVTTLTRDNHRFDNCFDNALRFTMNNPVILGSGSFFVHHSQVFDTLVCLHTATEDQLVLQYCGDRVDPDDVDTEEELLEICHRLRGCVADLFTTNIITKHGDLWRPG